MQKIYMKDLKGQIDKDIEVQGFIDKIRDLQYVQFIILRDATGKVQITIEKNDDNKEMALLVSALTLESTIKVTGHLLDSPNVKLNGMELIPTNIVVTSTASSELPIDIKNKDAAQRETRLDNRFLDLRREDNNLFFKCETLLEHAMREYCLENDFMEIHSPKISAQAAESGAEVFKLDYFGQKACLSQSPQFYKQMAMAAGFDKVFEIGPAFRAENSHTSYHATEINMADIEISWINDFTEVMDMEEAWLKHMLNRLREVYGDKIKEVFHKEISRTDVDFPRITFTEAKRILKDEMHFIGERSDDFERQEEKLLCDYAKQKYKCDFIFVTKFPFAARPFYHMLDEEGNTNSYDLLYKGVEITTGAQREHRYDILKSQIIEKGVNPDDLDFYLNFFKYGCPPHGGFAIGIARLMMQIFEIDNIREATFIYRGPTRLNP
ncbi:MAG: aspartate--tRNA(Asn) ligase [Bacilli bacterium]